MTIEEYFALPNAIRILVAEITQGTTTFYLSDGPYITESTDTPASLPFSPIIGEGGLPSYRISLGNVLAPRASVSTGNMAVVYDYCMSLVSGASPNERSLMTTLKRGATMVFKMAAPRDLYPYSDAVQLFTAKLQSIGGDDTGRLTFETIAEARKLFNAYTPDRGIYGRALNVPLRLVSFAALTYDTHPSGSIQAVNAVYDSTVTLATPAGYTANTTTGVVTLVNQPAGDVTADVDGYKPGGTWLQSTEEVACDLVSGVVSCGTFDTPADRIGYFFDEKKRLADVLDDLALGCAGFWFIDDAGDLRMRLWDVAGTPVATYDEVIEGVEGYTYTMVDEIFDSQEVRYGRNWTVQTALVGATAAHADFIATPGPTTTQTGAGDGSEATDAPLIESYFESSTPADAVAARVTGLLASKRDAYSIEVPLVTPHELGDTVTYGGRDGFIMGRELVFDGGVPLQRLEVLV